MEKLSHGSNEKVILKRTITYNTGVYFKSEYHENWPPNELIKYLIFEVIHTYNIVGISCYCIKIWSEQKRRYFLDSILDKINTDGIINIPYMPQSVLDMLNLFKLKDIQWKSTTTPTGSMYILNDSKYNDDIIDKMKEKIVVLLNADPTFCQLSRLNIVDELQELKSQYKKFYEQYFYQSSELSSMQRSVHKLQADMKQLLTITSKIQEENTQLTDLLEQEKEKTKQLLTTVQDLKLYVII